MVHVFLHLLQESVKQRASEASHFASSSTKLRVANRWRKVCMVLANPALAPHWRSSAHGGRMAREDGTIEVDSTHTGEGAVDGKQRLSSSDALSLELARAPRVSERI